MFMIRQFFPQRGVEPLHWTDHGLTVVRLLGLALLLVLGGYVGHAAALFGPHWYQATLSTLVGVLLGLLAWVMLDWAAWASGRRQEQYDEERHQARERARQAGAAVAADRPVSPAKQTATAHNAARAAGRQGAAPLDRRQQAARRGGPVPPAARQRPAGDPTTAGAVAVETPVNNLRPPAELVDAIVRAVTACGPRGASLRDVGDRLVALGQQATQEQARGALFVACDTGRLTKLEDDAPPYNYRWYAPAQLAVTDDMLGKVTQVITNAGTDPIGLDAIASGLLRLGLDVAKPALERAIRVLLGDGVILEQFGGYVRTGL